MTIVIHYPVNNLLCSIVISYLVPGSPLQLDCPRLHSWPNPLYNLHCRPAAPLTPMLRVSGKPKQLVVGYSFKACKFVIEAPAVSCIDPEFEPRTVIALIVTLNLSGNSY